MSYANCEKCLTGFWRDPDQHWKKLCIDCWKESKTGTHHTYHGNRDTGIEARLRIDLEHWRARAQIAESNLARHTCPPAALDLETLKRIRLLCHPDKHGNSRAATEISQRINQLIKQAS